MAPEGAQLEHTTGVALPPSLAPGCRGHAVPPPAALAPAALLAAGPGPSALSAPLCGLQQVVECAAHRQRDGQAGRWAGEQVDRQWRSVVYPGSACGVGMLAWARLGGTCEGPLTAPIRPHSHAQTWAWRASSAAPSSRKPQWSAPLPVSCSRLRGSRASRQGRAAASQPPSRCAGALLRMRCGPPSRAPAAHGWPAVQGWLRR